MLHVVSGFGADIRPWKNCLSLLADNDVVVFVADGVYTLNNQKFEHSSGRRNIHLFALGEDLKARSIAPNKDVEAITMQRFAQLVFEQDKSMSWF